MTDSAFEKMWSWAALSYVALVATLFAQTTTGSTSSKLFSFIADINARTVPVIGLPADLLAGLGVLSLTCYWSNVHRALTPAARIPAFHFSGAEIDPANR